MNVKLVAYGIAKEILGGKEMQMKLVPGSNIGLLKQELVRQFPEFEKLTRFSMAVNEEYREEAFQLTNGDEVVVIPPVSGG